MYKIINDDKGIPFLKCQKLLKNCCKISLIREKTALGSVFFVSMPHMLLCRS